MTLVVDFDGNESYGSGGTPVSLGSDIGYVGLEGCHVRDGMVFLSFSKGASLEIPERRLLRILRGE